MASYVQSSDLKKACKELGVIALGLGFTFKRGIFNDEPTNLWELLIAPCLAIANVAKSIAAEHRAGVYADIVADAYTRIDRHIRFNETALTDSGVFTDNRARSNVRMCSDACAGFNARVWSNARAGSH